MIDKYTLHNAFYQVVHDPLLIQKSLDLSRLLLDWSLKSQP